MFTEELKNWLDNFSQSVAIDMGEGGDDAECVAEMCVTCMSSYEPKLHDEYCAAVERHGYKAAMAEAAKHVRTL